VIDVIGIERYITSYRQPRLNSMKYFSKLSPKFALFSAVFFVIGCSESSDNNIQREQGLVYCSEGDPSVFNPQLTTIGTTIDATSNQLYNRLVEYNPRLGKLEPALATSWTISDDGRTYTFNLRKSVVFHQTKFFKPSRHFNADDVLFSFNRIIKPTHPFHDVSGGNYPFFNSIDLANLISDIEVIDPQTIVFHLNTRDSSFLANLATDFAVILSQEYGDYLLSVKQPHLIDIKPVGTGPFVLDSHYKDNYIRYKSNPNYWDGAPKIKHLVYDITPKSTNRIAKLMTGDCDVSALPQSSELDIIRRNPDLELQIQTGLNVAYWAFNNESPPFNRLIIRQALAHAINKRAIVKAVYYGSATTAKTVLPPLSWAYHRQLPLYEYNPRKAIKLLADAGYPNGFEMTLWAAPAQRVYNPNAVKMAELIQGQLAKIGVKVKIISYGWGVFMNKLNEYDYDSVLLGWTADNADPDNFFRPILSCAALMSGNNRVNWCEPKFDQLLNAASSQTEQSARIDYYHQAQQMLYDEVPLIPIAHALRFQVRDRSVGGISLNPYGGISFAKSYRITKGQK
jgi:cationic peptide transport system substrate-binding protein